MKRIVVLFMLCTLAIIGKRVEVEILVDNNYPPYSYEVDGRVKGVYIDIIKEVNRRMDFFTIKMKPVPWKRGLKEVETGRAFAILPPYYRPDERPYMTYSDKILREELVVVGSKLESMKVWPDDFLGSNIGINRGFASIEEGLQNKMDVEEADSTYENIRKLVNKRIEYYVNDRYSIFWELKKGFEAGEWSENQYEAVRVVGIVKEEHGYLGYSKYSNLRFKDEFIAEFDRVIGELKEEGVIEEILTNNLIGFIEE